MEFNEQQLFALQIIVGFVNSVALKREWGSTWISNLELIDERGNEKYYQVEFMGNISNGLDTFSISQISGNIRIERGATTWRHFAIGKVYLGSAPFKLDGKHIHGRGFCVQVGENLIIQYGYTPMAEFEI